jgi:hypothetical protein
MYYTNKGGELYDRSRLGRVVCTNSCNTDLHKGRCTEKIPGGLTLTIHDKQRGGEYHGKASKRLYQQVGRALQQLLPGYLLEQAV